MPVASASSQWNDPECVPIAVRASSAPGGGAEKTSVAASRALTSTEPAAAVAMLRRVRLIAAARVARVRRWSMRDSGRAEAEAEAEAGSNPRCVVCSRRVTALRSSAAHVRITTARQ